MINVFGLFVVVEKVCYFSAFFMEHLLNSQGKSFLIQQQVLRMNIHSKTFSSIVLSVKVEKILKGSLVSIPSPSPSVKSQFMGGKVCLRCKGKTLLVVVNKLLKTKSYLTSPSNVLPYYLK